MHLFEKLNPKIILHILMLLSILIILYLQKGKEDSYYFYHSGFHTISTKLMKQTGSTYYNICV